MIKSRIKLVISFCLIIAFFLNFSSNALANMGNWKITNARENQTGNWVYYEYTGSNAGLKNIHFSRHVDATKDDHMAVNNTSYYYFGHTDSFNKPQDISTNIKTALKNAWRDYFTVR